MRISDWSSDVCSSDLRTQLAAHPLPVETGLGVETGKVLEVQALAIRRELRRADVLQVQQVVDLIRASRIDRAPSRLPQPGRRPMQDRQSCLNHHWCTRPRANMKNTRPPLRGVEHARESCKKRYTSNSS